MQHFQKTPPPHTGLSHLESPALPSVLQQRAVSVWNADHSWQGYVGSMASLEEDGGANAAAEVNTAHTSLRATVALTQNQTKVAQEK